jgi:hypothetical protein
MSIKLNGATSGSVELDVPAAIGSDLNITIPGAAGTLDRLERAGNILQVVQNTFSTSTVVTNTVYEDTGLSASITPTSTSSKILIIVSQAGHLYRTTTSNRWGSVRILKDSTEVHEVEQALGGRGGLTGSADASVSTSISITYLDSPATTSSVTYKTQGKVNGTLCNYTFQVSESTSVITLMEVAG